MFNFKAKQEPASSAVEHSAPLDAAMIDSIKNSVAYIEFTPDGTIKDANTLFLNAVGYSIDEIRGKHHRMFCHPKYVNSPQYRQFWADLANGMPQGGMFSRLNKAGDELWLQATYIPVRHKGEVVKVFKLASDITEQKQRLDEQAAVFQALDRAQAIIEFTPDGTILNANKNFLSAVGYSKEQIEGKHHRMFCTDKFYQDNPGFWADLKAGQFKSGMFERRGAGGQVLWLEAVYNPIISGSGEVQKVIKFCSDITERVLKEQAVREAAEVAYSTSEETAQIAVQGASLLRNSVETSSAIAEQVQRTTESINQLNEQSKNIEAIVSTISAIAEQTNLLALNAAIEAARAGDQGRGFAVVADEVRQLAARTSQSTDEIASVVSENRNLTASATAMMNKVAQTAESGKDQINQVAQVMEEIRVGAENVSQTVANIQ
ncbi:methyl-accepting chemotaxis protein [Shewanella sp. GXUN23E]|uniref:methyl-accepting chemotaxis protein n=1 Tax=Shewanella sp. GXUN23E TaxID=3422498 RepID=UPI003D7CEA71